METEVEIVKILSEYFKFSLSKLFFELNFIIQNTIKPLQELDVYLKDCLIIFVEFYHFFIFKNNNKNSKQSLTLNINNTRNSVYSQNFWKSLRDIEKHMKNNILTAVDLIGKIRVYLI
jgi:hypothetical protein